MEYTFNLEGLYFAKPSNVTVEAESVEDAEQQIRSAFHAQFPGLGGTIWKLHQVLPVIEGELRVEAGKRPRQGNDKYSR